MFDEEAFGAAMGEMVREAVEPLHEKIKHLESQLANQPDIDAIVKAAVSALPPASPGKDADMDAIRAFVIDQVKALPAPKDGADGKDGSDGRPGKDGEPGAKGADGAGIADLVTDRDGALVATFTDGRMKTLGVIVGKDGVDGQPGKDGRDGMGFDDIQVEYDGEKTISLKMQRGEVTKEAHIVMPINIDRDVFKEGQTYQPGDCVTWAGSYWVAKRQSSAKPDSPDSGFRLVAKKGRDGKDGRNGIDKTAPVNLKD